MKSAERLVVVTERGDMLTMVTVGNQVNVTVDNGRKRAMMAMTRGQAQAFIKGVRGLFMGKGEGDGDADVEIDDTTASASRA